MMKKTLISFLSAVEFLTVLPVPWRPVLYKHEVLGRSMAFYPVVGLFIGFCVLCVYQLCLFVLPFSAALVFALVFMIVLTGALHLDGFSDVCDGFYAGKTKEDILRIMKDSYSGVMGVTGIFCVLSLKIALWFSCMQKGILMEALLLSPSVSRWCMTVGAGLFPYARAEQGTGRPFVERAGCREILVAFLFLLAVCYGVSGFSAFSAAALTTCVSLLFLHCAHRKIGGVTGDVLGAVNEISEVAMPAFLVVIMHGA